MIPGNILSHNFTRLKMDSVEYVKSHMVCGKEAENGRKPTKFKLMGHWILAPDNPGLYARYYGAEYLKHVPQKDWWSQSSAQCSKCFLEQFKRSNPVAPQERACS